MATITATFDTVTKKASFAVDGSPVPDVCCFAVSQRWTPSDLPKDGDLFYLELTSVAQTNDSMTVVNRVTAAADGSFEVETKPAEDEAPARAEAEAKLARHIAKRFIAKSRL
jgi:hypothetical protein